MRQLKPTQRSQLVVASPNDTAPTIVYETKRLIEAPNWTPDGRWLVFNSEGLLYRISPDGSEGPSLIDTGCLNDLNNDHVVSPDGAWLYVSANDGHIYRVSVLDGQTRRVSNDYGPDRDYRYYLHGISPDGTQLAYVGLEVINGRTTTRICTIAAEGGEDVVLTDGNCPVDGPEYSPDGKWIYFNTEAAAKRSGHAQIFRMTPNGEKVEQITFDDRVNWFPHVSPNGMHLVYLSYPPGTIGHPADKDVFIRLMAVDGVGSCKNIDHFNGGQGTINVGSWAPDSQSFAYVRYPMGDRKLKSNDEKVV